MPDDGTGIVSVNVPLTPPVKKFKVPVTVLVATPPPAMSVQVNAPVAGFVIVSEQVMGVEPSRHMTLPLPPIMVAQNRLRAIKY